MTFARTVRLLATFVIVTGISASGLSLFAQSLAQGSPARQYDPAYDGAPVMPASLDEGDWGDIPAYVSNISGDARLERDGEATSDFEQVPLQIGDQIRTTRGRVEILYDDGSVVALDEYSAVSVDAENTYRLHTGRVKIVTRSGSFGVDAAPAGVARLRNGGDYRVTLSVNRRSEPEVEVAVARGSAELENQLGRTLVRQGTRALTTASFAPSVPYAYVAPNDEFERWTESLEADRYSVTSARYLPTELRAYGGYFDRDGDWARHQTHGWVWYPRVAVGWEPFRSGRWSFVVGFGYNWIGHSRWEWPTYYYGRWDRYGSNWFWVPTRPNYYRHVGYSSPRTSAFTHVNYYSRPVRPQPNRPLPSYRADIPSRSRIVESPRIDNRQPRVDDRQPSRAASLPNPDRVAVPRSSATSRGTFATRPSASESSQPATAPVERRPDTSVFGARRTPDRTPDASPRTSWPTRESSREPSRESQSSRPDIFSRRPPASTQEAPPQRSAPSTEPPSRPSRTEARPAPASNGGGNPGRMASPERVGAPPAGSRSPSSSSSSSSSRSTGTAVRRGGGGH